MKSIIPIIMLLMTIISSYSQNHDPVAVRDTASTLSEVPVIVNVLLNDYDPDGDSIYIFGFPAAEHGSCSKMDSTIAYTSFYYTGLDSVKYRIGDYHPGSHSNYAYLVIQVNNNPDLPFARNDTGYTISCDSLMLNVTKNDSDPNGDSLEIDPSFLSAGSDQVLIKVNDSMLLYRSIPSFTGTDIINYRVRKKNNISLYSNNAKAFIHVGQNSMIPVAVNDTVNYLSFSQKHIIPLQNDLIPTQDSIDFVFRWEPFFTTKNNDQSVDYFDTINNRNDPASIFYYIRRKNDPAYYSNTAVISIQYEYNPQFFHTKNDTLSVAAFCVLKHDLVTNDHNPNPSDPLKITFGTQGNLSDSVRYSDRVMTYYPDNGSGGMDSVFYVITSNADPIKKSTGKVMINLKNKNAEYLDVNNVRALFNASGLHFFRENAEFEVPRGSGKTSLFANSLWIGGKDALDSLHFAGEKYRQGPYLVAAWTKPDYYAGPVMDSSAYGYQQDSAWSYVWKLNKTDIEYHLNHFSDQGYQPIRDILTWPGNGNISLGQEAKLAPYFDSNVDGIYDPMDGDYPAIRGDQALFFIFNDDRGIHKESQGKKLKVEIQGLAYAFDLPNDTAFKNTVFLHYSVINRSEETYTETYFGIFTDTELGIADDDYIGCDVERNMYFGYNGDSVDGWGNSYAYGSRPPAQGVIILGGPKMDDDGIDNPKLDNQGYQLCNESINGLFFGDTIVDNERLGMQRFIWFFSSSWSGPPFHMDPFFASDYYNMMNGKWRDGTDVLYGGMGHVNYGGYGPACRFMVPWNSDSLNWGTGCLPPNGPVDWTMETAQLNPHDCKGVSSSGPFTFKPGDRQDIDIAFSWARDYESSDPDASLIKLRGVVDKINLAFAKNKLPDGSPIYGITEHAGKNNIEFDIYPNPAKDFITIEFIGNQNETFSIRISSLRGEMIRDFSIQGRNTVKIKVSDLPNGMYIIQCQSRNCVGTEKFIVIK